MTIRIRNWALCLLVLVLPLFESHAMAEGVTWLFGSPSRMVDSSVGFGSARVAPDSWQAVMTDGSDPGLTLRPVRMNAAKMKHLYIKLFAGSGASLQVFFSHGEGFSERSSFRCLGVLNPGQTCVYRLDIADKTVWNGTIRNLRIDLDGCGRNTAVRLYNVGVSAEPVETLNGADVVVCGIPQGNRAMNDRMAAWHHTLVATDEARPSSSVGTYIMAQYTIDEYTLAKFVPYVQIDGRSYGPAQARRIAVEDIPGGVRASYFVRNVEVTTEIVPLLVGRDTLEHDGAALYTVRTRPSVPVVVRFGGGDINGFQKPRAAWLRNDSIGSAGDSVTVSDGIASLSSSQYPLHLSARSSGKLSVEPGTAGGQCASASFPNGDGTVLVSFAATSETARKIVGVDPLSARKQVESYYSKLLQCRVETPVNSINRAFSTALCTLEYNWLAPYGWNECIHHWPALWHMQHSAGCEWIGQTDRSRDCALTMAAHLLPDGSAPQFMPSGSTKKEFGGSNQFYAWQIRHYWNFTADHASAAKLTPALDRVIAQTFEEYDPDHDNLLAWGQQTGNQEDYVSTPFNGTSPSVEGINMLRTGAVLANALGNTRRAQDYDARASEATARLRRELWQPDLGRFAFYRDPHGVERLDGQYHTLIYPVIWGVLDPLDSWTSIRHMRDRLMDAGGAVYCSNNFPNHVICTCGPQTGVAQQPWGAWGLASVGLRNETYRPIKAAADWVMNADHRGSWPEVSEEPTASYFSPPAGLFVQSTIEALFGLQVNKPTGSLIVAPSFPDSWPTARLSLPEYSAKFTRNGNALDYTVTSAAPLSRRLRWKLPPCSIGRVLVDGKPSSFTVAPGVGCIELAVDTKASTVTHFRIEYSPIPLKVTSPGSIAEGDPLRLTVSGCTIERIDDRCGVLSSAQVTSTGAQGRVRDGLLAPYEAFGRLGRMNFARRSFFLYCSAPGGVRFWQPVDITVLPRYETAQRGEMKLAGDAATVRVLVRNNTSAALNGKASLKLARLLLPASVSIPARSEKECSFRLPADLLALLSPGENKASLVLPGNECLDLTVDASALFAGDKTLGHYAQSRLTHIPLPDSALKPDTDWRQMRRFYCYGHMPWAGSRPPLSAIAGKSEITVDGLPCVSFSIADRRFVPVSWSSGTPEFTVDLKSAMYKKLYLLVIPFLDNHDTFSTVGRVTVRTSKDAIISRTLSFPGDLDWWCPEEVVGPFSTAREARPDRRGLLPILGQAQADWAGAKPSEFPQPKFWASCLALKTPAGVMNVVEIDLGQPTELKSVSLASIGVDPGFGLVAVSAEKASGQSSLEGTAYLPPSQFREPRTIFRFDNVDDLLGWRTEGEAFSVRPVPSLFDTPTLNSLAKAGEAATGKAISPDFRIQPGERYLKFTCQGGRSLSNDGVGMLRTMLVDSDSGAVLDRMYANGSHFLREERMNVERWQGKRVHLEMEDRNTGSSYSWLGVKQVDASAE